MHAPVFSSETSFFFDICCALGRSVFAKPSLSACEFLVSLVPFCMLRPAVFGIVGTSFRACVVWFRESRAAMVLVRPLVISRSAFPSGCRACVRLAVMLLSSVV